MKLNPKQERFVDEYLIDLNATQAAIRAGYSEKTAYSQGQRLLNNVEIQQATRDRREQLAAQAGVTQERVIEEYVKIAFLDPSQFFDSEGQLIPIHQLPKPISATIAGIDHVKRVTPGEDGATEYTSKIKFTDKLKALDSLSRHLGIFEKDNEQKRNQVVPYETVPEAMREAIITAYNEALKKRG